MRTASKISLIISQGMFILSLPWLYQLVFYLHPVALAVVWFCVTSMIFFIAFAWKKEKIIIPYVVFLAVFVLYSLGLLVLLFFRPANQSYEQWNVIPFVTIWQFLSQSENGLVASYNLLANVGLFIPLGIFFMLHMEEWRLSKGKLLLFPIVMIFLIEITQFITNRGSFDVDDLILNVVGVLLGYLLYPYLMRVIQLNR